MRHAVPILLLGLLAVQVLWLGKRRQNEVRFVSMEVGQALPFAVAEVRPDSAALELQSSGCSVGFICSLACGYCSAIANGYASGDLAVPEGVSEPYWFLPGSSGAVESWAEAHDLPLDRVFTIGPKPRGLGLPSVAGDIWVTPMRVVLTEDLVLQDARPSGEMPEARNLAVLCRDGGIAPGSLSELRVHLGVD